MQQNIEIKARINDPDKLRRALDALCPDAPELLRQDDCFFHSPDGRLKLRQFADGTAELLFYRRDDTEGPKTSSYWRSPVSDAQSLRELLSTALGSEGRVVKQRWLYRHGRTRIHLDQVQGLGDFMELEVVLQADDSRHDGEQEAQMLMRELQIRPQQQIAGAYLDLIKAKAETSL